MPLYEPVARFHVASSNSLDLSDADDDDDDDGDVEIDERQSFISFRGGGTRRIPSSHGRNFDFEMVRGWKSHDKF